MQKIFNLFFLSLTLFLNTIVYCQQSICSYEKNVDYLYTTDLTYVIAINSQLCCSLCSFRNDCVGFVFVEATQKCVLKSAITLASRTASIGRTSGGISQNNFTFL